MVLYAIIVTENHVSHTPVPLLHACSRSEAQPTFDSLFETLKVCDLYCIVCYDMVLYCMYCIVCIVLYCIVFQGTCGSFGFSRREGSERADGSLPCIQECCSKSVSRYEDCGLCCPHTTQNGPQPGENF